MTIGPLYTDTDEDLRLLILSWYRRARQAQLEHAMAASWARRSSVFIGVPTAVLGVIVGSGIFATINETTVKEWHIVAGLLSIASAVLAALQTFLRFDERSREHEAASRAYGIIRRELGELGAVAGQSRDHVLSRLEAIRQSYDSTSSNSRNVPDKVWDSLSGSARSFWPPEFSAWPSYQPPAIAKGK